MVTMMRPKMKSSVILQKRLHIKNPAAIQRSRSLSSQVNTPWVSNLFDFFKPKTSTSSGGVPDAIVTGDWSPMPITPPAATAAIQAMKDEIVKRATDAGYRADSYLLINADRQVVEGTNYRAVIRLNHLFPNTYVRAVIYESLPPMQYSLTSTDFYLAPLPPPLSEQPAPPETPAPPQKPAPGKPRVPEVPEKPLAPVLEKPAEPEKRVPPPGPPPKPAVPKKPAAPAPEKPAPEKPAVPPKPAVPKPAVPEKPATPKKPETPPKPVVPEKPAVPTPEKPAPEKPATPKKPVTPPKPAVAEKPAVSEKPAKPAPSAKPEPPVKPVKPVK